MRRSKRDPDLDRLLSKLQDTKEELLCIGSSVSAYIASTEASRPANLDKLRIVVNREADGISWRLRHATELLEANPKLGRHYSDALTRICNRWCELLHEWQALDGGAGSGGAVSKLLDEMVLELGYITVPPRANDNLKAMRVGQRMNFHEEFEDELPSKDARDKILGWMVRHPATYSGVADLTSGTVVKASTSGVRRALSWPLWLLPAAGLITLAANTQEVLGFLDVGSEPFRAIEDRVFMLGIISSYLGATAHVFIAALKQQRRLDVKQDNSFTAMGNAALWVHVNELYLLLYVVAIPVVAYTLFWSQGEVDLIAAFFVGYSIDSLLGLWLDRFDAVAGKRTERVSGALAGTAA